MKRRMCKCNRTYNPGPMNWSACPRCRNLAQLELQRALPQPAVPARTRTREKVEVMCHVCTKVWHMDQGTFRQRCPDGHVSFTEAGTFYSESRVFCSMGCYAAWRRAENAKHRVVRLCVICGSDVPEDRNGKTCSTECQAISTRNTELATGRKRGRPMTEAGKARRIVAGVEDVYEQLIRDVRVGYRQDLKHGVDLVVRHDGEAPPELYQLSLYESVAAVSAMSSDAINQLAESIQGRSWLIGLLKHTTAEFVNRFGDGRDE